MNRPTPRHTKLANNLRKAAEVSGFRQVDIAAAASMSRQQLWHMLEGGSFSEQQYRRVMDAIERLAKERARQLAALRRKGR